MPKPFTVWNNHKQNMHADNETTITQLKEKIRAFANAREWEQFHSPKNLSMAIAAEDILESFDSPGEMPYVIEHTHEEFTSVCPMTGHPDFRTVIVRYSPAAACVELKSLKLYLQSYRNDGIFYENVTNTILDDLVATVQPRHMKLVAAFTARGGITTNVTATYEASAS